jgi:hypothetical protein
VWTRTLETATQFDVDVQWYVHIIVFQNQPDEYQNQPDEYQNQPDEYQNQPDEYLKHIDTEFTGSTSQALSHTMYRIKNSCICSSSIVVQT